MLISAHLRRISINNDLCSLSSFVKDSMHWLNLLCVCCVICENVVVSGEVEEGHYLP